MTLGPACSMLLVLGILGHADLNPGTSASAVDSSLGRSGQNPDCVRFVAGVTEVGCRKFNDSQICDEYSAGTGYCSVSVGLEAERLRAEVTRVADPRSFWAL